MQTAVSWGKAACLTLHSTMTATPLGTSHQWTVIRTVYIAGTLNSCLSLPDAKRHLLTKQVHDKTSLSDELRKRTSIYFCLRDRQQASFKISGSHEDRIVVRKMWRYHLISNFKCEINQRVCDSLTDVMFICYNGNSRVVQGTWRTALHTFPLMPISCFCQACPNFWNDALCYH